MDDFEEREPSVPQKDLDLEMVCAYDDDDKENAVGHEFTDAYEDARMERLKFMPRDEVNRTLLKLEFDNRQLLERVNALDEENGRLRVLLDSDDVPQQGHRSAMCA